VKIDPNAAADSIYIGVGVYRQDRTAIRVDVEAVVNSVLTLLHKDDMWSISTSDVHEKQASSAMFLPSAKWQKKISFHMES